MKRAPLLIPALAFIGGIAADARGLTTPLFVGALAALTCALLAPARAPRRAVFVRCLGAAFDFFVHAHPEPPTLASIDRWGAKTTVTKLRVARSRRQPNGTRGQSDG